MSDSNVYTAERILAKRVHNGVTQYFIKWKGYSRRESTWEPVENILDPGLLTAFERKNIKKPKKLKTSDHSEHQSRSPQPNQSQRRHHLNNTTTSPEPQQLEEQQPQQQEQKQQKQQEQEQQEPENIQHNNYHLEHKPQQLTEQELQEDEVEQQQQQQQQHEEQQQQQQLQLQQQQLEKHETISDNHHPSTESQETHEDRQQSELELESDTIEHINQHRLQSPKPQQFHQEDRKPEITTNGHSDHSQSAQSKHMQEQCGTDTNDNSIKNRRLASKFAVMNTVITDVTVNDQTITISESKTNQGFFREVSRNSVAVDTTHSGDMS